MERFNKIYLFATENISGYLKGMDFTNKRVLTVASSLDHALNLILLGAKDVVTFDINILCKYYMEFKLEAIKKLNFNEFCQFLLYENDRNLDYETFLKFELSDETKKFWIEKYAEVKNNGYALRNSGLFDNKYYDPYKKIEYNLYLEEKNYKLLKEKLKDANITFINSDIKNLEIKERYDYAFFSNISDYLKDVYGNHYLEKYKEKIDYFKKYINNIYFAYVYDTSKKVYRSDIDDLKKVESIFKNIEIKKFKSALINECNISDAVLIY